MKSIFKYIPMVTLGQILGTVVAFPLLIFLVNLFYYSNKYNDDAEQYYEDYMNNSYDIEIAMPEEKSQYYLENQDEEFRMSETFITKMDKNYFSNPRAVYIPFYSIEYKKFFNILNSAAFFLVRRFYMLRCLFGALYAVMRFFGASWVLPKHEIPHPNQWGI